MRLFHFGLVAALGGAAVVLAAVAAAYLEYQKGVTARTAQEPRLVAERLAGEPTAHASVYRQMVAAAARQPAVTEARPVTGSTGGRLETAIGAIPGAVRARLLPPDAGTDPSDAYGLGYAGRDLLRRAAEGGEVPAIEVLGLSGDAPYLAAAAPVAGPEGATQGVLLVAVEPARVEAWLRVPSAGGYAEVRQGGRDGALLAKAGEARRKGAAAVVSRAVSGTAWRLHYWPPAAAGVSRGEQMVFVAIGVAAAVAVALLALVITGVLGRRVRRDLEGLVGHSEELLAGRRGHGFTPRLLDVKQAALAVERAIEQARWTQVDATAAKAEAEPPEGMFVDRGGMELAEVDHDHWPAEAGTAETEKKDEQS